MASKRTRTSQGEASSSSNPRVNLNVNFGTANAHMRARFMALKQRPMIVTKFPHRETLEKFNLTNGVEKLLTKGGLQGILNKSAITYRRPTLEFLASVERSQKEGQNAISFQLMGRRFIMSYAEVGAAFGWIVGGLNWNPPNDVIVSTFWYDLTGINYKGGGGNKVNYVVHPCFRYVLRLMNNVVFLNGGVGGVTRFEIRQFWALAPEGVGIPAWVEIFVTKCILEQGKTTGKISFGGMITLLGDALGVGFDEGCGEVQHSAGCFYDDYTLKRIEFLDFDSGHRPNFRYLIRGGENISLPPYPRELFDIPDNTSTLDMRRQFFRRVVEVESEDDDEEEEMREAEGGEGSSSDPWRQVYERMGHMESGIQALQDDLGTFRGEVHSHWEATDARYSAMESQFSRLFTHQESMMNRFDRMEAAQQEEMRRQEEWRKMFEEQRSRHPGDYQGFPGSGSGFSGC